MIAPNLAAVARQRGVIFPEGVEIPQRTLMIGSDRFEDVNPRREVTLPAITATQLITVGEHQAARAFGREIGRFADLAKDPADEQVYVRAVAHKKSADAMNEVPLYDSKGVDPKNLQGIGTFDMVAPGDFLDDLPMAFSYPGMPVVRAGMIGGLLHGLYLNAGLEAEKQVGRLKDFLWYTLPSPEELESFARLGNRAYGTQDGKCPDLTKRPYSDISEAVTADTGVEIGGKVLKGLCGVALQPARCLIDGQIVWLLGSWGNNVQGSLDPACRTFFYTPVNRLGSVCFRFVLPRAL